MSAIVTNANGQYCRPAILDQILGGGHKVIDASAGTGKTFTIERIVVELLLTGAAQINQILVVTFTEKATAELRARIRATIEDVMSGKSAENARPSELRRLSDDERERLRAALFSFHHSPIHTIHSFCHRMLTELTFDSGVRFGLDLTSGRHEFHEALRAELRERLKADARVERACRRMALGREAHFGHARRSAVARARAALPANRGTQNQSAGVDLFDECVRCERAGQGLSYRGDQR